MEIFQAKKVDVTIMAGDETLCLTLRPLTYARIIEISALCGNEFVEIMQNPTPLSITQVAYCLLPEDQKKKLDDIEVEIDGEKCSLNKAAKLYYLLTETNISDGQTNMVSITDGIEKACNNGLPSVNKKKANKILARNLNLSILKRFLILLRVNTATPTISLSSK